MWEITFFDGFNWWIYCRNSPSIKTISQLIESNENPKNPKKVDIDRDFVTIFF